MKLKLVLENKGRSWTLTPNREHIIGSSSDCDICLDSNLVSSRHLKFSFNPGTNTWHVYDLDSSNGTFVNGKRITDYPVKAQTPIAIAGEIFLLAKPEMQRSAAPVAPPLPMGKRPSGMKVLTWKEYVEEQVEKQPDLLSRLGVRFYMVTGFRNTPWIRRYQAIGFDAFDGYIIPNFRGSAEAIAVKIEHQLGQLKRDKKTDCFVTQLTDAHIADSATQKFLGAEWFPIIRGGVADYRRFAVVSYHRVRTYLLVENYGTDLFVSWVTRFEPDPTPGIPGSWLGLASLITLILLSLTQGNLALSVTPLLFWLIIYIFLPKLMQTFKILPKRANSQLLITYLLIPFFIFILIAAAIGSQNQILSLMFFSVVVAPAALFIFKKGKL